MHRYMRDELDLELSTTARYPPEVAAEHDATAEELETSIERAEDARNEDRVRFISERYAGTSVPAASETVGYKPSTGLRRLSAWEDGGLGDLLSDGEPRWHKVTAREEHQFVSRLATGDRWVTDASHDLLDEVFDVSYSDRHLRTRSRAVIGQSTDDIIRGTIIQGFQMLDLAYIRIYRCDSPIYRRVKRAVFTIRTGNSGFAEGCRSPAGVYRQADGSSHTTPGWISTNTHPYRHRRSGPARLGACRTSSSYTTRDRRHGYVSCPAVRAARAGSSPSVCSTVGTLLARSSGVQIDRPVVRHGYCDGV